MMNKHDDALISLYKKTRSLEPSAALDAKVLASARSRLNAPQNKSKRVIWALSSVAVIVLSVNVALKLLVEPDMALAPAPQPELFQDDIMAPVNEELTMPSSVITGMTKSKPKANVKLERQRTLIKKRSTEKKQKKRAQNPQFMQAPMADTQMFESSMVAPEPLFDLPKLPFSREGLLAINNQLKVVQSDENTIRAFFQDRLVLMLKQDNSSSIHITAYPQSSTLGIFINWGLLPSQLYGCIDDGAFTQCAINPIVIGYFKGSLLSKVTWVQEPLELE